MSAPRWPRAVAALCALVATACTAPKSEVCRKVCAREAECVETGNADEASFDESECVAACAALEHDPETRQIVVEHAACVAGKRSCSEVLSCK